MAISPGSDKAQEDSYYTIDVDGNLTELSAEDPRRVRIRSTKLQMVRQGKSDNFDLHLLVATKSSEHSVVALPDNCFIDFNSGEVFVVKKRK